MNREDGYHVVHGGTSINVFAIDGSTREPDTCAAAFALRPGMPRMFVELWKGGTRVKVWHPNDIAINGAAPRLT